MAYCQEKQTLIARWPRVGDVQLGTKESKNSYVPMSSGHTQQRYSISIHHQNMTWTKKVIFRPEPQMSGQGTEQHRHRVAAAQGEPHMDRLTTPASSEH